MISFFDILSAVRRAAQALVFESWRSLTMTHPVERGVRLAVSTPVEAMPHRAPRGGLDRRDATEAGKGCFGGKPLGVVACGDEELAGGLGTDTEDLHESGAARAVRARWTSRELASARRALQRRARRRRGSPPQDR